VTLAPDVGTSRTVTRAQALRGTLRLPSDKSVAHRALIVGAMASGRSTVTLDRPGADVRSTLGAVERLGAVLDVREEDDGRVRVELIGGGTLDRARLPGDGGEELDCGNSGTTMRLLSGALAGRPKRATLVGDESLSRRPMERVAAPLRAMGAMVATTDGHAPVRVEGSTPLRPLEHRLPVASAQVLGSITLAALAADGRTTIAVPGPTRDHTERMLGGLGAAVTRAGLDTTIDGPVGFAARDMTVPGDISSAAAWLVAGTIHPDAAIRLEGVGLNPSRLAIVDVLREMGAAITVTPGVSDDACPEPVGSIEVRSPARLRPIRIDGARVADLIDELPLLAVAMAAADGESELRDAGELRLKESDRIALVVANLAAIGVDAGERPDGWVVRPGRPRDGSIRTAGDHRIAMAFAVAALTGVSRAVDIDDPACVTVSYPGFWDDLGAVSSAGP
jgi:3-phosphoshikimate 1-carboxyvinyltransferase